MEYSEVIVNVKGGPHDGEHVWNTEDDPLDYDNFAGRLYDMTKGVVGTGTQGISPAAFQSLMDGTKSKESKGRTFQYIIVSRDEKDGKLYLNVEEVTK